MPRPTNTSTLIYTLLSPLASRQNQLFPCRQEKLCHTLEGYTARVDLEEEVRNTLYEGSGVYTPYPEGGTASVAHEGDTTKSAYLTFEICGMYKINWGTIDQESESNKYHTSEPNESAKAILEIPQ